MDNNTNMVKGKEMLRILELHRELGIIDMFIADYKKLSVYFREKKQCLLKNGGICFLLGVLLAVFKSLLTLLFPDFSMIIFTVFMCILAVILFCYFFDLFSFLNNLREYKEIMNRLELKRKEKIESIKRYPHS